MTYVRTGCSPVNGERPRASQQGRGCKRDAATQSNQKDDDEGHRHEENHDRAVRAEDLVVVLGRQEPWVTTAGASAAVRSHTTQCTP
jgi:hypothetical protein